MKKKVAEEEFIFFLCPTVTCFSPGADDCCGMINEESGASDPQDMAVLYVVNRVTLSSTNIVKCIAVRASSFDFRADFFRVSF